MIRNLQKESGRKGFTLIELIVILSFIGGLLSSARPFAHQLNEARKATARFQMKVLRDGVDVYELMHNKRPNSLEDLLVEEKGRPRILRDKSALIDPWGQPYRYNAKGKDGPEIWCESPHGVIRP